jgi:3-(methylthio)propionyl---CoA ligase
MYGQMMQQPLLISSLLVHAERHHGDREIVSRRVEGDIHRTPTARWPRARASWPMRWTRWAAAGDRVATLAWNGYRHMELYFGVSGSGAVLHTLNPRLHPDQMVWIADHAEDQVLCFDLTFLPLVEAVAAKRPRSSTSSRCATAPTAGRQRHARPAVLRGLDRRSQTTATTGPSFDENTASRCATPAAPPATPRACCTATAPPCCTPMPRRCPTALGCSARDSVLPVVPMFHVNAWGIPYSAPMTGAKLVFPGAGLDGKSLYELFEAEGSPCPPACPRCGRAAGHMRPTA